MEFSVEFKKLREAVGTQQEVADILGLHVTTISQFERQLSVPPEHRQRRYLQILSDRLIDFAQAEIMRRRKLEGII